MFSIPLAMAIYRFIFPVTVDVGENTIFIIRYYDPVMSIVVLAGTCLCVSTTFPELFFDMYTIKTIYRKTQALSIQNQQFRRHDIRLLCKYSASIKNF